MIAFRPFARGDLRVLALRNEQADLRELIDREDYAAALEHPHLAVTALTGNAVLGCAGVMRMGTTRGYAWALVGASVPPAAWVSITREVRRVLNVAHAMGMRRIEAHVLARFKQGHRWAEALGFRPNALDEIFEGREHHVEYVRVFPPTRLPVNCDLGVLARLAARYDAILREAIATGERWATAKKTAEGAHDGR